MYLEHFGLERPPFKITPDTRLFYKGSQRGAILDALIYAIGSGEGIVKVVGEVGSGKTMLCRMLEERISDTTQLVYIANPSLSPENILHLIAFELSLKVDNHTDKLVVMQSLQNYLLEQHRNSRQVVILVEEAQSMPLETLEEIRLLSNLETHESKLLQIVLFGQPELDENLATPSIRQLRERIAHSFNLQPFGSHDIIDYLNFRMRAVGYRGPDIFTPKAARAIEKASGGLTRRMNILADKSLLAAFASGTHQITRQHVATAIGDCEFGKRKIQTLRPNYAITLLLSIIFSLIIGLVGLYYGSVIHPSAIADKDTIIVAPQQQPIQSAPPVTATQVAPPVTQASPSQVGPTATAATPATQADIKSRLQQTTKWLPHSNDNHYTIQLLVSEAAYDASINRLLAKLPPSMEYTKIYVYPFIQNGTEKYSLIYDEFASWKLANDMLEALPDIVKANKPYIRPIRSIRNEINLYHATIQRNAG